jgi:hypothetical protein
MYCQKLNLSRSSFVSPWWRRSSLLLIVTILSTLTVACGGALTSSAPTGGNLAEPAMPVERFAEAEAPAAEEAGFDDSAGGGGALDNLSANAVQQAQDSRVIIYTGNMSLTVDDTRQAVEAITSLANEQGGYVSGSNIYQAGEVPRGNITIRIPAENYQATVERLRTLAERVESETTNTQDVTEEFTDLEARKTNLEFTEAALQELLEERQQVGRTSDILEVYRELTNIRGQIEQIEGRLRYLSNQSALSTISIELIPDVLSQPVSVAGWEPQGVAKTALQSLITALQGIVNVLIWLGVFVLPLLIILAIPLVIAFFIIRSFWRRYRQRKGSPPKPAATPAE